MRKGSHNTKKTKNKISKGLKKYFNKNNVSQKTRDKLRDKMLGREITWANKISKANKGKKKSKDHCENMSKARMKLKEKQGYLVSKEARKKMSIVRMGRKITWGNKISKGRIKRKKELGYLNSLETRKKMSDLKKGNRNPNYGKHHSKEHRKNQRIGQIKYIKSCYGQISPRYNKKACRFFDEINKKFNLNGLHAENKGEYGIKDLGYWVDYYDPGLNLVIEWNEESHYSGDKKTEKHIDRQNEIRDYLGCYFINIREKNFVYNKEAIMKRIENIIEIKRVKEESNVTQSM